MRIPTITDYRVEEVEVPAPMDEQQSLLEDLGIVPPSLPAGPPRRMIKITLEVDEFPEKANMPLTIVVGRQTLTNISVWGGGRSISGLINQMPHEGDQIVMRFPTTGEEGTVLAGTFDTSKVVSRLT